MRGRGGLRREGGGVINSLPLNRGGGLIREGGRLNRGFTITGIRDTQLCLLMYDNYCKTCLNNYLRELFPMSCESNPNKINLKVF